ncbi:MULTISPECIES: Na/Pi cotransporter family protein [unclassified Mesorhizobium]|uniref:Na/Pi cotransporter family protein n=1 Tax=unclassified Mesorhizobium TaxID=325217 RepID=UPI001129D81E|nr:MULTISPECIES: Na/Pi cotransporter family protein [unclassified Mesorhizobium]MBZ9894162.1 Na/Pi cotransporter family protein [Mesorhizobium sp. BR1-1-6]MBZ9920397.1 Na/Pi cotransporter family protein [Mesorhizobium sp. BR1-1-7]MBZ9972342.1 Na/Pi cotransporter family protein [Mesorhizobium sp. BR1-1-12]MCA0027590.1 Na/Pi cotransporter family protein [Mesorhizobium sp. B263B1A]MCA0057439.1 Na/Pi cotransporter family protein [Mesorhizobium sp. B261B1A]
MSGSVVLLHLAGAVALMLFATRMVKTGVERAYGDVLRHKLRATMRNPVMAVLAGTGLAIALQSSTAVTLLVGSFAGSGIVSGAAGQLAVRGAEIGSALVVKLLTFDLTLLVPLCLITGTVMFMATERRDWRQTGRILVGIGLLILSLEMIGQASEPLRNSQLMPVIINYFSGDSITAYLLAALITWLFQSSIAAVLLMATLAGRGLITPELGVVLILGVNLGSSIIAPMLTRSSGPEVRVVPIGNLLMRGLGSLVMLILVMIFRPHFAFLGATAADQIVNAHILFNVLILLAGLPLAGLVYRASEKIVVLGTKTPAATLDVVELSALNESALDVPSQALANATREVVRVCETVEIMLKRIIELYESADADKIKALAALDDRVDRKHAAIKLYLAKVTKNPLTEDEALRCQELIGACVKLEQVGDIIVRNMLVHVKKKFDRGLEFTDEGWSELCAFHASVLANARLAFNVLVSRDAETARQLVLEKERLRDAEKETSASHFLRLREGTAKSVETSSIHLDTIRDLKQINSLLASMAYPVLEERGLLGGSRLKAS